MRGCRELFEIDRGEEFRMNSGDVISLDKVIRVDLPVCIESQALLPHGLIALDRLICQLSDEIAELVFQVAIRSNGDEDQAAPFANVNGLKRPVLLAKDRILSKPGSGEETALVVIGPIMIGAADRSAAAVSLRQEPRAAVAADIAEAAQSPVPTSQDENFK